MPHVDGGGQARTKDSVGACIDGCMKGPREPLGALSRTLRTASESARRKA